MVIFLVNICDKPAVIFLQPYIDAGILRARRQRMVTLAKGHGSGRNNTHGPFTDNGIFTFCHGDLHIRPADTWIHPGDMVILNHCSVFFNSASNG